MKPPGASSSKNACLYQPKLEERQRLLQSEIHLNFKDFFGREAVNFGDAAFLGDLGQNFLDPLS